MPHPGEFSQLGAGRWEQGLKHIVSRSFISALGSRSATGKPFVESKHIIHSFNKDG